MVLERRNFFSGKKESVLCQFFSNLLRIVGAILLVIGTAIVVGACCLFEKIYCSKKEKEELFLLNLGKSFLALLIILSAGVLIIIVTCLSYIFKKTLDGQNLAEKDERPIVAFMYSVLNLFFRPLFKFFSKVYELCWTLWDKLDRR